MSAMQVTNRCRQYHDDTRAEVTSQQQVLRSFQHLAQPSLATASINH
jgi:uncharacterized protein YqiB (DUF1249 family)